jgi:hypothetical protein
MGEIKLRKKIQRKRNMETQKGIKIGIDGKSSEANNIHQKTTDKWHEMKKGNGRTKCNSHDNHF